MWPEPRVGEKLGRGSGRALQAKVRILTALGSQRGVLRGAMTIRFAFGEDQCGISVDNGEIGEEATVIVQARGDGGLGWKGGYRGGDAAVERSGCRYN